MHRSLRPCRSHPSGRRAHPGHGPVGERQFDDILSTLDDRSRGFADLNDERSVDISEASSLLYFLLPGGVPLPPPTPGSPSQVWSDCGVDLTQGSLGCATFPPSP